MNIIQKKKEIFTLIYGGKKVQDRMFKKKLLFLGVEAPLGPLQMKPKARAL